MSLSDIISIISMFYIFALLAVGMLLIFFKTAPELRKHKYHKAKRYLAAAVIIVAMGEVVLLTDGSAERPIDIFPLFRLIVAAFQACLFTFLILILFHSKYVNIRNILKHLLPTIVFIIAYILTISIHKDVEVYTWNEYCANIKNPALLLRTMFAITYAVQLILYISLFKREQKKYKFRINELQPDLTYPKLRLGTSLFYQAAGIGVFVLMYSIKPTQITDTLFTLIVPFFYISFAVRYINLQRTLLDVIVVMEQHKTVIELQIQHKKIETELLNKISFGTEDVDLKLCPETRRNQLCIAIRKIILKEKAYRDPNMTRDNLIELLGTNKELFIDAFQYCFEMSFPEYLNLLRLKDAITLLEQSDLSIEEISERVGYGTVRTFQRQFQNKYNMSPKDYRKVIAD